MTDFSPSLSELRSQVDDELFGFLKEIESEVEGSSQLVDEISGLLRAGGKRLRPAFCYWGYRAAGGEHSDAIVRVAAALELLHTFALVHDDIMDASEERRGVPTAHVRLGVGEALLIGDLALVLADDLFMRSGFAADSINRAFETYSRMRKQVIVGQHLELGLTSVEDVDEDNVRMVARMKSGRYSIREPLLIGACLGPRADRLSDSLADFGELLGEAFQIRDDLLGTFGSRTEVGKPVDSDVREGKRNILYATTARLLGGDDREFFISHWGRGDDLTGDDVDRLKELIRSSGGLTAAEDLATDLKDRAVARLDDIELDPEPRAALSALIDRATARTS